MVMVTRATEKKIAKSMHGFRQEMPWANEVVHNLSFTGT